MTEENPQVYGPTEFLDKVQSLLEEGGCPKDICDQICELIESWQNDRQYVIISEINPDCTGLDCFYKTFINWTNYIDEACIFDTEEQANNFISYAGLKAPNSNHLEPKVIKVIKLSK